MSVRNKPAKLAVVPQQAAVAPSDLSGGVEAFDEPGHEPFHDSQHADDRTDLSGAITLTADEVLMHNKANGHITEVHKDSVKAMESLGWVKASKAQIKAYEGAKSL